MLHNNKIKITKVIFSRHVVPLPADRAGTDRGRLEGGGGRLRDVPVRLGGGQRQAGLQETGDLPAE